MKNDLVEKIDLNFETISDDGVDFHKIDDVDIDEDDSLEIEEPKTAENLSWPNGQSSRCNRL